MPNLSIPAWTDGSPDQAALRATLNSLVARHAALRSGRTEFGDAVLLTADLSGQPADTGAARLVELVSDEVNHPFDGAGPFLRGVLVRLRPRIQLLVLVVADRADIPDLVALRTEFVIAYRSAAHAAVQDIELPFAGEPGSAGTEAVALDVPGQLSDAVQKLAAYQDCSPAQVALSALIGLIHRYTAATDILVATPSVDDEPGLLRCRVPDDPTGADLLSVVLDAHAAEPAASETVSTSLPKPRFAFDTYVPSTRTEEFRFDADAGAELRLCLPATLHGSTGQLRFRADRFDRAQAQMLARQYVALLGQLVTDPDRRLADCALLTPAERNRAVKTWNSTNTDYPDHSSLVELFEAQTERAPDARALRFPDGQLTYRELDADANRFAKHLIDLGIGPGSLVALCLHRGADWVVCALGILKSGAAYVPLDPEYPPQRLAAMAQDAAPSVTVAHASAVERLTGIDSPIIVLDEIRDALRHVHAERPDELVGPHDLAYVMYTSGSTGRPKGVAVTHRNVVRLVRNTNYVDIRPGDRVAQASSTSFDAATFEVWGALLNGAELVGMAREELLDGAVLGPALRERDVRIMFLTTSLAMQLGRTAPDSLASLRQLIFGGELPDGAAVRDLIAHSQGQVVNGYGPTECTTFASSHHCRDQADTDPVPLGRPIANTQLYVLDPAGQPVLPGVSGELYIGGDGVARGYWHAPALTAQRFVPDHLGTRPGARLYRTGDLARYRADGTIEFLGRVDRQVKIRGFRIEPAEIEACLHRSDRVRHATVQIRSTPAGEPALVGYLVPTDPADDLDGLGEYLRAELPPYLVPAALVPLTELPLTRNGKLDTSALPDPALPDPALPHPDADPPRTEVERQVARVWQAVLGTAPLSREDNFFQIGGHSLKVAQVTSRIAAELAIEIPLRTLFDHATVTAFADAVTRLAARHGPGSAPDMHAADRPDRGITDLLDELDALAADELTRLADDEGDHR